LRIVEDRVRNVEDYKRVATDVANRKREMEAVANAASIAGEKAVAASVRVVEERAAFEESERAYREGKGAFAESEAAGREEEERG
jgi:hypothetical protein